MSVDITSMNGRYANDVRSDSFRLNSPHGAIEVQQFIPPASVYLHNGIDVHQGVFSSGWGECLRTTEWFAERMALSGILTTAFNYPHMRGQWVSPADVQEFRYDIFSRVMDAVDGEKSVIAHSEGAYAALTAAATRNDISATLLAAPAGLIGKLSAKELVAGGMKEGVAVFRGERTHKLGSKALLGALWGLTANVVGRPQLSVAEVHSIAMTDARPTLEAALGRGANIGMLVCEFDQIFPAERVIAHLDGIEENLALFKVLAMNHVDFLRKTEAQGLVTGSLHELLKTDFRLAG